MRLLSVLVMLNLPIRRDERIESPAVIDLIDERISEPDDEIVDVAVKSDTCPPNEEILYAVDALIAKDRPETCVIVCT
jgi:hypothetical protein